MKRESILKLYLSFIIVILSTFCALAQTVQNISEAPYRLTHKEEGIGVKNYAREYAVLYGTCTGGSISEEGKTATVTNNQYGYYVVYKSYNAMWSANRDDAYNREDCTFKSKGEMDQYGKIVSTDDPQLVSKGTFIRNVVDTYIECHSTDYWFYIESFGGHIHHSVNSDCTSYDIWVAAFRNNQGLDFYRIKVPVPMQAATTTYCSVSIKPAKVTDKLVKRTVNVYYNNVLVGTQDGDVVFPNTVIDIEKDLNINVKPGYKITKKNASGSTYNIYLEDLKYTVKFNANGGSGTMSDQTFNIYESKALSLNTYTKTGYYFSCWNSSADGTGASSYSNGETVSGLASEDGAIVNLYAQWEESKSDLTISITNLQTNEYILFNAVCLTGLGKDKEYTIALNRLRTSETLKDLPVGNYRVTALYWSQSEDVDSVVNPGTVLEEHDITGNYEFKFVASKKTSPQPHAEASINNVWSKK